MKKSDLIDAVAVDVQLDLSNSEKIVNLVFETMSRVLIRGERIDVRGFGLHFSRSGKNSGQRSTAGHNREKLAPILSELERISVDFPMR